MHRDHIHQWSCTRIQAWISDCQLRRQDHPFWPWLHLHCVALTGCSDVACWLGSILHRLDYSIPCCHACSILHRTRHRYLAHSMRSRSSTDRPHSHLGNSLPRFMLMITFDLSWADTFKFISQTLSLASTRFSACCSPAVGTALSFVHGFWGPGPWLFRFTGSRVPSLAVFIPSRPFGTCFNQPTIHPLGLKASVVHGRFIRRRSGHVAKKTCWRHLTSDEPPRHDRHARGRPHTLELAGVPTIYSHSLNSSAPTYSRCRDSLQQYRSHPTISRSTSPSKSRQSRLPSHASGILTGPS